MTKTAAPLALAVLSVATCFGQTGAPDYLAQKIDALRGIHIYSVSVYSGYMSSPFPDTGAALGQSVGAGMLGSDVNYGGTFSMGWQRHRAKTNLGMMYTGGYGGMARYSAVNGYSQTLNLSLGRELSRKWGFSINATGSDTTIAQYLFQPARYSEAMQMPLSFDDFAASLSVGQFSNAQVASMLTGAPVLDSPAQALLVGNRILSYSGQASLTYDYSSRLHFHISGFSAAGQNRLGTGDSRPPTNFIMPRSTGINAGAGFSYSLSPRTDIGFDANEYLIWNGNQKVRGTTSNVSLGRKLSRRWFVRGYAGVALTKALRSSGGPPPTTQLIGGGSLGFKTYSQKLAVSYDRSTYDNFGFAVGTNTAITGSWVWRQPGSRWTKFANFGDQQVRNAGFASLSGWRATAGVALQLPSRTFLTMQYARIRSVGRYNGMFNDLTVDSVRLSLSWTPGELTR